MTGDKDAVWIVRKNPVAKDTKDATATYDVFIRFDNNKWKPLPLYQGLEDTPSAIAAMGRQLHVISAPPCSYVQLSSNGTGMIHGLSPNLKEWDKKAAPLAICAAEAFGKSETPGIIAIVPQVRRVLPTTQPSQPTTATSLPAGITRKDMVTTTSKPKLVVDLSVIQTVKGTWTFLTKISDVPIDPDDISKTNKVNVSAMISGQTLYVLVGSSKGTAIYTWNQKVWEKVWTLAEPTRALALHEVQGTPTLLTAVPAVAAAEKPKLWKLQLTPLQLAATTPKTAKAASIIYRSAPVHLKGDQVLQSAVLGEYLALLWPQEETYKFALCGLSGEVHLMENVDVITKAAPLFTSTDIQRYFTWTVFLLILAVVLIGRSKGVPRPFIFPAGALPGALPKRLLAFLIDLIPFMFLAVLVAASINAESREFMEEFRRSQEWPFPPENMPVTVLVCSFCALIAFVVYGTLAEQRFGTTIGKKIMKLRVIGDQGAPLTLRQAFLRNIVKLAELHVLPLVAIFVLMTPGRMRLGDMLAKTAVIEAQSPIQGPSETQDEMPEQNEPEQKNTEQE